MVSLFRTDDPYQYIEDVDFIITDALRYPRPDHHPADK